MFIWMGLTFIHILNAPCRVSARWIWCVFHRVATNWCCNTFTTPTSIPWCQGGSGDLCQLVQAETLWGLSRQICVWGLPVWNLVNWSQECEMHEICAHLCISNHTYKYTHSHTVFSNIWGVDSTPFAPLLICSKFSIYTVAPGDSRLLLFCHSQQWHLPAWVWCEA